MAQDLKSNGINSSRLIASGGLSGGGLVTSNNLGLAVYSASNASDASGGLKDSKMLAHVGSDSFFFVSGSKTSTAFARSNMSLFGGEVVTSGSLESLGFFMTPQTVQNNINVPPNYNAVWYGPTVTVTGTVVIDVSSVVTILS